jgi:hypothetical protein
MANPVIDKDGAKTWYNGNGLIHREDGPAVIHKDGLIYSITSGYQAYYMHGKRHKEDGPAYIHEDGSKSWWINGLIHRENGPAVIYTDGTKRWFLNDKEYTEDAYITIQFFNGININA